MLKIYTKIPNDANTNIQSNDIAATLIAKGGRGIKHSDVATFFTAEAIKAPFSKFKPMRSAELFPDRTGNWYKGIDGNCGFAIPSQAGTPIDASAALDAVVDGNMNGWVYLAPRGYEVYAERYRLDDFKGYDTEASLVSGYAVSESAGTSADSSIMITMLLNTDENSSSLRWVDFEQLGNCYLGARMVQGSKVVFRTADKPLSEWSTVQISTMGFSAGVWQVTPFICSDTVLGDSDYTKKVTMYTLPKSAVKQVTIASTALTIVPSFQYKNGSGTNGDSVIMSLTITNPSGEVTLRNNYAMLYYADSDEVGYDENEKGPKSIPALVVPTGTTTFDIGSFTGVSSSMRLNCKVVVTLNYSQYELRQEPAADIVIPGSYTVDLNGQWQLSSVANPDSSLYEGVYESFYNRGNNWTIDKMFINIEGYDEFTIYVRSYGESNWDYVMVAKLDEEITSEATRYNDSIVYAHTRGQSNGGTAISSYTKVTFNNIGGGSHRICLVYGKDGSSSTSMDRGFLLIQKRQ